ncbi:unnamed protein product [Dibothriocephalus latus]|uniref:NADH dehydrogenase [ubiquinone] 1 alpha subcomplex assembly factor 3 n=1 Tax=Dibothriocephalus latus TaxID=60516 RepID=A0A3P6V5L4_DIBLA|nr:unnamed protein product [Dibothriocephalus latus]
MSAPSDALVDPKKGSSSAEVDIVNYSVDGVYLVGYNQYSFVLSNGVKMYGPVAAFPRNVFSWNVTSPMDINEESLSLFFALEPKLDILLIGKGSATEKIDHQGILRCCWKHNVNVEIYPTPTAIGTFNFLNAEERYVAAALIPPIRLDVFDSDRRMLKQLADGRELRQAIAETSISGLRQLPPERKKLISSEEAPPLEPPTSHKSGKG